MATGHYISVLVLLTVSSTALADSVYCPQGGGYINVGMTQDQVVSACGQPISKTQSDKPATQQVPVTQMIYNNAGNNTPVFWALPSGYGNKNILFSQQYDGNIQSGGTRLQVDIVNDKVSAVNLNGNDSNAFSICNGQSIQIGDPASSVSSACGTPSLVNNTYINQVIPGSSKPEIWVYQISPYQPPMTLTFVNGKLQSISN